MPKDDMQRTLTVEFPGAFAEYNNTVPNDWHITGQYGDWQYLSNGLWFNQTDIDLTGYAMQKKTFYPYSSFEQRSGITAGKFVTPLTEQPYVIDITICSSVPLTSDDIASATLTCPGFIQFGGFTAQQGRFNRDVIIHGEWKWYTEDSTLSVGAGNNTLKLLQTGNFSSLEPTAADKIYCYRIIGCLTARDEGVTFTLPATRVLIPGNLYNEDKIPYMMRLKRSYELANQV